MDQWAKFAFDIASWTVALIVIYEGVRRATAGRRDGATIALIVGGIAWCVLRGATALYVSDTLGSMAAGGGLRPIEEPREDWGKELAPEAREKASLALAALAYASEGKSITYFDRAGERKRFVPNQDQLRQRESNLAVMNRAADVSHNAYATGLRWLLSAVFAVCAGFAMGKRGRSA